MMNRHEVSSAPGRGSSTRLVTEIAGLAEIAEPEVNVCVLRRAADEELAAFVRAQLLPRDLAASAVVDPGAPDLEALVAGAPPSPGREAFLQDARLLVEVFADLLGCPRVGVRLVRLTEAMCPRLHVDRVIARLVTTYAGPGTEWVEQADVRRELLGHGAKGQSDEASGVLREGARVEQMTPFAVGLLKGEDWPGNLGRGAVHRSPAGAPPRVLLTLDALA